MKHVMFSILFCILFFSAGAQNNFVEVSVSDTVQVRADYFVFRITATPDYDYAGAADTTGMRADPNAYYRRLDTRRIEKQKEAAKVFETKLRDAGFSLEPLILSDFAFRNNANFVFSVSTRSLDAVNTVTEMLKTEKGMSISLTQVNSLQEDAATLRLQQKLIAKAKIKAAEIARLSGKKLGTILSVTDKKSEQMIYFQNNISTLTTLGIERNAVPGEKINPVYPLTGIVTVKFAWL